MLSTTSGSLSVDLKELVSALLAYDALTARAWVARTVARQIDWSTFPFPSGMAEIELALAASVLELLAARAGIAPPSWARNVPASPKKIFLVKAADRMRRLRMTCELEGPEELRRRQFFAPPDFLTVA